MLRSTALTLRRYLTSTGLPFRAEIERLGGKKVVVVTLPGYAEHRFFTHDRYWWDGHPSKPLDTLFGARRTPVMVRDWPLQLGLLILHGVLIDTRWTVVPLSAE